MADMSGFQKFLGEAADFFRTLIERIKKADRRLLIMIAAAVVLLIVIIALIAHGVSSGNETNEPVSVDTPAVVQEQTTNEPVNTVVKQDAAGTYRVTTSGIPLNLRLAADSSSERLEQISNGTELEVFYIDDSSSGYGWGYVEYNGQRGWVSMEYMTPVK